MRGENVTDINSPLNPNELKEYILKIPNKKVLSYPYSSNNPYGDGNSTKKLINIILETKIDNLLMQKQVTK